MEDNISDGWFGIGFYTSASPDERISLTTPADTSLIIYYHDPQANFDFNVAYDFGTGNFTIDDLYGSRNDTTPYHNVYQYNNNVEVTAHNQQGGDYYRVFDHWERKIGVNPAPENISDSVSSTYITDSVKYDGKFNKRFDFTAENEFIDGGSGGQLKVDGNPAVSAPYSQYFIETKTQPFSIDAFSQTLSVNGKNILYNFLSWSDGNIQNPRTFTPNDNTTVKAIYKGHFASAKTNAYSSNSQRKFVRTTDGVYHTVYVDDYPNSLPSIYYTHSSPDSFSSSWSNETLYQNSLYATDALNPSIDYYGNNIYCVYEKKVGNNTQIIFFDDYVEPITVATVSGNFGYCKPVIAVAKPADSLNIYIVWETGSNSISKYSILKKTVTGSNVDFFKDSIDVDNTTNSSTNFSIAVDKSGITMHLAWQDGNSIKYQWYSGKFEDYKTISSGSGYDKNRYPSISLHEGSDPIVTWQGGEYHHGWDYYAVMRYNDTSGDKDEWNSFYSYGTDAKKSNVNSDSAGSSIIAYSQNNGSNYYVKMDGSGFHSPVSTTPTGNDIQVSNANVLSNIKIMNYKIYSSLPNLLQKSTASLSKMAGSSVYLAKQRGVIVKGDVEFIFDISDVILNGENILFTEVPDTVAVANLNDLNARARIVDMNLDKSSELLFSHKYYVVNKEHAEKILKDNDEVKFRVELVRSSDNYVCGVVKEMVYNKNNVDAFEIKDFKLYCSGLKADKYYLRLKTVVKGDAEYFMGNGMNGSETLAKKDYQDLEVAGVSLPLTYELEQNYPNPFNPVTTISYAVPNAGRVEISVYDIRGRLVKTLLDTYKEPGRYTVKFDGKNYASGLYIYRLKSGDFFTQRKMLLVK